MEIIEGNHIPYEILAFYQNPSLTVPTDSFSHLLVMGGAMNVDQLTEFPFLCYERELIQDFIGHRKPVLGICLGAQLIARALGARVYKNTVPEVGWSTIELKEAAFTDPLFSIMDKKEKVFQWHGDTFALPEGSQWLASSPDCPHQAFRYAANVYALQFHLEASLPMIQEWMKDETDSKIILRQTHELAGRANRLAGFFFKKWLEL